MGWRSLDPAVLAVVADHRLASVADRALETAGPSRPATRSSPPASGARRRRRPPTDVGVPAERLLRQCTTGTALGNRPAGPGRHVRAVPRRVGGATRARLRIVRAAHRAGLGGGQHPDLDRGVFSFVRPPGDVLRRRPGGPRQRHRVRLPVGGHCGRHQPDGRGLAPTTPAALCCARAPWAGRSTEPVHRSGRPLAVVGVEVQRRRLRCSRPDIWTRGAPTAPRPAVLAGTSPTQMRHDTSPTTDGSPRSKTPPCSPSACQFYLLFSGGIYTSSSYAQRYAVCASPTSPCTQTDPDPILSSYGTVAGPGGGSWFADASGHLWLDYDAWSAGCTTTPAPQCAHPGHRSSLASCSQWGQHAEPGRLWRRLRPGYSDSGWPARPRALRLTALDRRANGAPSPYAV